MRFAGVNLFLLSKDVVVVRRRIGWRFGLTGSVRCAEQRTEVIDEQVSYLGLVHNRDGRRARSDWGAALLEGASEQAFCCRWAAEAPVVGG